MVLKPSPAALSSFLHTPSQCDRNISRKSDSLANKDHQFLPKVLYHTSPPIQAYTDGHYWDYSAKFGPDQWEKKWPTGTHQSPIDIKTHDVVYDESLGEFNIDRTPVLLTSTNTGVQAAFSPISGEKELALSGGSLPFDGYKFASFHFHWGDAENTCGCEHTVDGHRYAAELHIVHFNEIAPKPDGNERHENIAVLGVFLDAAEENPDHPELDVVLRLLERIPYSGQSYVSTEAFSAYSMLPGNSGDFFTYAGSLTTPPLSENVRWTVFAEPIKISQKQVIKNNPPSHS